VNQEPLYNIDTTPEEDKLFQDMPTTKSDAPKKGAFAKIFCIVLSLHVAVAGIIGMSATSASANAASEKSQNLSSVTETFESTNSTTSKIATVEPTPKPTPLNTPAPLKKEQATTSAKKLPTATPPKSTNLLYTKEYVVKQGDTIYSISKKYKLSVDRLIKINNIKDVNKIQIGQTLKFM